MCESGNMKRNASDIVDSEYYSGALDDGIGNEEENEDAIPPERKGMGVMGWKNALCQLDLTDLIIPIVNKKGKEWEGSIHNAMF